MGSAEPPDSGTPLAIRNFRLDLATRKAHGRRGEITLLPGDCAVLEVLMIRRDEMVPATELLTVLRQADPAGAQDDKALVPVMKRLRTVVDVLSGGMAALKVVGEEYVLRVR